MTTVPPPTTPPVPPAATAAPAPVVLILAPPPAVAALPAGAPLEGVVLPPPPQPPADTGDARPTVTVRTPQGDVTIRLPAPLPAGSPVELQVVRASADQATVRVITVNDQPAAQVLAQLRQAAANTASQPPLPQSPQAAPPPVAVLPPANAWTPQGPVTLPALGPISAFVTQGTPPAPTAASPQPNATPAAAPSAPPLVLATGGELAVRVTAVQLPATPAVAAPPSTPVVQQPPVLTQPALAQPVPVTGQAPVTPPSATPLPQQPVAAAPPAIPVNTPPTAPVPQPTLVVAGPQGLPPPVPAPPAAPQPAPPQAVITGVVTRATPTSPPVITTDFGQIQLNVRANLPVGTRVTLEVTAQLPPQPGAAPPPLPLATLPLSGPPMIGQAAGATVGWPNLSEAIQQLQRADPAAAAEFASAIPDGGPRTAVAVIAFVQAMRTGDSRSWPGDTNLRALERLGPRGAHLASQISDEVSALSARATENVSGEWRALPVPWAADGRIDRITLVSRREGDAEDDAAGKKGRGGGIRFLINLDLSRLGPLQLDGMFRKEPRGLDLMIRTKQPLPDDLRLELTGIFGTSTAAMGLKGGLSFQVTKKFADPLGDTGFRSGVWA